MANSPVVPEHLDVGPIRFRVLSEKARLGEYSEQFDDSSYGFTHLQTAVMGVDESLAADVKATVLVHEWLHACAYVAGLTGCDELPLGDEAVEERVVAALAPVVLDSLRRNPELVRYVLGRRRS